MASEAGNSAGLLTLLTSYKPKAMMWFDAVKDKMLDARYFSTPLGNGVRT
jgi:hypothetical protein